MNSCNWGAVLLLCLAIEANGQVYSNHNFVFGIDAIVEDNLFGAGVSFFDFDNDGWDDLTFLLDDEIRFYRNNSGTCEPFPMNVTVNGNVKHATWVDFDNDGDNDLFITQYMNYNKFYRNDGNMEMVDITSSSGLSGSIAPHFGCSWGDYDLDGDLDVYVCNYIFIYNGSDAYNYWDKLYRNNGDGTFSDVSVAAGISDGINSTFQSVWIDYNHDLWPDLYTINDKYFPNYLYHNNGDGTFTEVGEQSGTAIAEVDAMTASGADMNKDGWEDMFVSNTSIGSCSLLRNNGDLTYDDIAVSAGVTLDVLAWGGSWIDFDLDMDEDLYVCEYYPAYPETPNKFMRNLGNETFVNVNSNIFPFDFSNSYSCAAGDWDHDGYPDLAVSNYAPQNANFWISGGGNQHYLKVSVEGTVSNRDGLGTRIVVWVNGVQQMRYTRCGENYLGQDSDDEIFGMGAHATADSVQLFWPGGLVETIYDVATNQHIHILEGSVFSATVSATPSNYLCAGDSILLDAGNYMSFVWDNGDTNQYRYVSQAGEYSVVVTNDMGFSDAATIVIYPLDLAETILISTPPSCFGFSDGYAEIIVDDIDALITWFDGQVENYHGNLASGDYSCTVLYGNGCESYYEFEITEPDSLFGIIEVTDVSCFGMNDGQAELEVSGGTPPYLVNWGEMDSISLPAGNFFLLVTDSANCELLLEYSVTEPLELTALAEVDCLDGFLNIQLDVNGGTGSYQFLWSDGSEEEFLSGLGNDEIVSVHITDENGCEFILDELSCELGLSERVGSYLSLYPNPVSSVISIDCAGYDQLEILDVTGNKFRDINLVCNDRMALCVDQWPSGCYFFLFTGKELNSSLRVIVLE